MSYNLKGGNMNIYLLRHGFTNMNKEKLYNGQVDEDLIEEGIKQAEEAREMIKNMEFDVIYCSPLTRTKHTCEIVNCNHIPVVYDERLKERTLGWLDGKDLAKEGLSKEDFYNYYYQSDIEGFEESPEFYARVHSFLDELKTKDYRNVLMITHGGVLRATYYYFHKIPKDGNLLPPYQSSKNCQLDKYELSSF